MYKKWPEENISNGSMIGPHEGIELSLMKIGAKPLALVQLENPKALPVKCVAKYFPYTDHYWVAAEAEAWRIPIAERLFERRESGGNLRIFHIKLGRLLGYSKAHIRAFLKDK